MSQMSQVKRAMITAVCIALCVVLPMAFHSIQNAGAIFCPMHIPVLLCGLVCGWQYGAAVGFVAPLLRSVLFGMPPMYPVAIAMAFELLTYGLVIGLVYRRMAQKGAAGAWLRSCCWAWAARRLPPRHSWRAHCSMPCRALLCNWF